MYLNRRNFLRTGVAGFGSILLMPSCLSPESRSWRFFTDEEARCVIALAEQAIPEDEHGGGATEAGVIHYIDRQLVAVFTYEQAIYQQGIAALQATCMELHGKRFENLDFQTQYLICSEMWEDRMDREHWGELLPSRFFKLLVRHSMQGFYGAPRHGGNRNYMSYQMMGLDFPLVVGRNLYQQIR